MAVGMKFLLWTSLLLATTSAIPAAVFPFNSQVPTAARINQPYSFQFSGSTFAPGDVTLIYSLSGQPAWLSLDSTSRTLTGTPGQADTGSSTFILTAADNTGAAHMQCTLVVSSDPTPTLQGDLGSQLAESANLSSSNPPVMALLPKNAFNFHFRQNSFIDIVQRSLYYYATLTDHTPLPAWLHFDPAQLAFEGVAPLLSAFPQTFEIMLIASDVPGFAGSSSTFTIMIGERQLVFVPEEKTVRIKAGEAVAVDDLGDGLLLNGGKMDLSRLKSAEANDLPAWMGFDSKTLKLQGNAPDDPQATNVTITASDENGDTAMVVVHLALDGDTTALFTGSIGTLDTTPGEYFEYTIPTSVIGNTDATLMLVLPSDATWLQFDSGKRELKGDVPTQASSIVTATLNARAPNAAEPETQIFKIDMKATASVVGSSSATTLVTSHTSPTDSSIPPAAVFAEDAGSRNGLPERTIAGIVVGVLLAVAILFAILFVCCHKRRTREGYERHTSPSKRIVSRPIPPVEANSIAVTTELHRDIEKAVSPDNEQYEEAERPPQIALNLSPQSARNSKWTSRFSRNSLASSLGNGEDMIRADANIPEWGHESAVLQTPHDSFSVPAQMARVSRQLSDTSPSKRAFRRLRAKRARHQSEDDVGLGIGGLGGVSLSPHRAESRQKVRSRGLEATMERSSCGSLATEATSVLNMRPSDFPRPPTQTSMAGSRFMLAGTEKRKSLRMVARSDSINDDRSLEEKRISFIKKRASTTLSSPLFSASLGPHRRNGHGSTTDVDGTSPAPSRRSKRIKSQLTSYSESSSIQPTRSSNRLSQRIRSTFAPNFPRVITRSTLAPDDDGDSDKWETSSESSSSIDLHAEMELADEMALPRHERSWVLPNEASPTPPPTAPPSNRRPSIHRASTPNSNTSVRRTKPWTTTSSRSISPLAAQALDNASASLSASAKISKLCRSRLSEPMALTSKDSLSKVNAKTESADRPRLVHRRSGRPVSVEDVQRLSSLRAERVEEEEEVGAGALLEDGDDAARERVVTDGSGKVFI
jgi:hypothetical protein